MPPRMPTRNLLGRSQNFQNSCQGIVSPLDPDDHVKRAGADSPMDPDMNWFGWVKPQPRPELGPGPRSRFDGFRAMHFSKPANTTSQKLGSSWLFPLCSLACGNGIILNLAKPLEFSTKQSLLLLLPRCSLPLQEACANKLH